MLTIQQCKHVITYYTLDMMNVQDTHIPVHISRDCVYLNKMRGELCSNVFSNPKIKDILNHIHNASNIEQLNSVPINSMCSVDKKTIPVSTSGVQLIIYNKNQTVEHICIQKKYQQICYYYFKLRYFPNFIQKTIKEWLCKQSWYIPRAYPVNNIITRIHHSNIPNKIHNELTEIMDTFNKY
jgi:hypothetical protein